MDQEKEDKLNVSDLGKQQLKTIALWTGNIASMGYLYAGFLLFFMVFYMVASPDYDSDVPASSLLWNILIAIIIFIPFNKLMKFSKQVALAVENNDPEIFTMAFSNLKTFFKFMGVFLGILLIVYIIVIVAFQVGIMIDDYGF